MRAGLSAADKGGYSENRADIDWHKWAIRGIIVGTIAIGGVGGYAAIG